MQQLIKKLEALEVGYLPNPEICHALCDVSLTSITGVAGTGKSTLLSYVVENYAEFGSSVGFTTRERRDYEAPDAYTFYGHTEESIEYILGEASSQKLVQFAVHPFTKFIYGSELSSYNSKYNLIDIMASAVEPMRSLPFGSMVEITIVCNPEDWEQRFAPRFNDSVDAAKRIAEGINSIEWSLDQGGDMVWLDSSGVEISPTAESLVSISKGEAEHSQAGRAIGERLLNHLKSI